jgi:amidase
MLVADDRPEYLPAWRLIELYRSRTLSPVDVLQAQIGRIDRGGGAINAFTHYHFDEAMKAAKDSEARYRRGDPRTLEGICVAVKDEFDRKGWVVTSGSRLFKDNESEQNHPVVDKLLEAGAILHVQTTAPEFFLVAVTWSDLWGTTRNPWNAEYTPGGSSGGSAAALSAGMTTLAIGSDMGGSIRIPSALNGLYGGKPSYGRIASPDPSALVPHASPGPLARDAGDLILLQNVMSGPARGCPSVLRPALHLPMRDASPKELRVAVCLDQGWATLEEDVRRNSLAALRTFEAAGIEVDEIDIDLCIDDTRLRSAIEKALFSTAIGAELTDLDARDTGLTSYARRFVTLASDMRPSDAREAAEETLRIYRIIDDAVFERGYHALITATVATTMIAADFDPTKDTAWVNGKTVDPYAGWFLTSIFSLLNWMPVVNVPADPCDNGVPCGLQIACRPYDDVTAAALAYLYAKAAEPVAFDRIRL